MTGVVSIGLDGTIVAQTKLGAIDGEAGTLSFCGYNVHDLATKATWEEVVYLLWNGDLPTPNQLAALRDQFAAERTLSSAELALLERLPLESHGMDAVRTAISALSHLHGTPTMRAEDLLGQGIRLTAKLPTIMGTLVRLRAGKAPVDPDPSLGHAENMLLTLHGERPDPAQVAALNTYLVLLAEHGLNVSTFVARVVSSAQNDLHAAIVAALAALKGLSHGGANEFAMRTFLSIGDPEQVPAAVEGIVARKERLMGVGHRIYKVEDPRVRHLRRHSAALAELPSGDPLAHAIAERVANYILEHPHFQARRLYPNVEFYSAPLLYQLGLPLDYFTVAFACARMPGWIGHIREQLGIARLVRPEAEYIGPLGRVMS